MLIVNLARALELFARLIKTVILPVSRYGCMDMMCTLLIVIQMPFGGVGSSNPAVH